jgi:hypothetical protein
LADGGLADGVGLADALGLAGGVGLWDELGLAGGVGLADALGLGVGVGLGDTDTDGVDGTEAVWTGTGTTPGPRPTPLGGWRFPTALVLLSGLRTV